MRDRPPIHPGEVLLEDLLTPMKLSKYRLSKDIGVAPTRVQEIIDGKRSVSADTALRLSRYFGTSAELWMGLKSDYELERTKEKLGEELKQLKPLDAA